MDEDYDKAQELCQKSEWCWFRGYCSGCFQELIPGGVYSGYFQEVFIVALSKGLFSYVHINYF